MAKCDEGYICSVCEKDVNGIINSDLYLRYVTGLLDPELLHTTPERHIRCNKTLSQYIIDDKFEPIFVEGAFDKRQLDPQFVKERQELVTRGWHRLRELQKLDLPIIEYPLPEVIAARSE